MKKIVSTLSILMLSTLTLSSDTLIKTKLFDPLSASLAKRESKISDNLIRVDMKNITKDRYQIVDVDKNRVYMIDKKDNKTLIRELNKKSSYNDQASLEKVGKGVKVLGKDTTHYIFKAGNITCNHVYIADIKENKKDINTFLKTFTMVPFKIKGMGVKPDEKSCQKAARDAAIKIKSLGMPMLILDKENKETLFEITAIDSATFKKEQFKILNKDQALSIEETMQKAMKQEMHKSIYNKVLVKLEQQDMPKEDKERFKKELKEAYESGNLESFLEKKRAEDIDAMEKRRAGAYKILKDKNFKNIHPKDIVEFIKSNKDEKPLFIYFSSQDRGCTYCIKLNTKMHQIAKNYSDRLNFISVDFFPWTEASKYKNLKQEYNLNGLPFYMIVYKDKTILYTLKNRSKSEMEKIINIALNKIKDRDSFEALQDRESSKIYSYYETYKVIQKYLKKDGYKAMAIITQTKKDGFMTWQVRYMTKLLSQESANKRALKECEKVKNKYSVKGECKLYMVDNTYVYGKSDKEITKISNSINIQTAVDKSLEKFENRKDYKAFALAVGSDGSWRSYWTYGYKSQEEADKNALAKCEKARVSKKIDKECKIIRRGDSKSSETKPKKEILSKSPKELSIKELSGYKIESGDLNGKDHKFYKTKYDAITFGCDDSAVFESASNEYQFHNKDRGRYEIEDGEIAFLGVDEEGEYQQYIVNLKNNKVVVNFSKFQGPQGRKISNITKVKECR